MGAGTPGGSEALEDEGVKEGWGAGAHGAGAIDWCC